ncbi:MAG TPA: glycosyltransferase family 2 protein [Acidimicrobiales bacterium]
MFVFLLQVRDTLENGRVYLFTIYIGLVWVVWLRKVQLSRRYRPYTEDFQTTVSVVIPVVDEPEDLFREVLRRIDEQAPDEVIVVINGPRNPVLEKICDEFERVRWMWTEVAGKRNAVRLGVEASTGEVVFLVDSDTIWTPGTLRELVKPFADPRVGGATTRQRILAPDRHVLTRWADWMENLRNEYSMPAMSVLGTVGCLPGRTIAFRRKVLIDAMPAFLHAKFLGVFLEVSDDRTLTNECLKQGYRTVYQSTSVVYTDAPITWRKMAKQQLRWARGSQYNTMRMLPWMLRNSRTLAFLYVCDILLPFLLLCSVTGWLFRAATSDEEDLFAGFIARYGSEHGYVLIVALTILMGALSSAIRQSRHLAQRPSDFFRIPAFLLIGTFFLTPIRLLGFVRMAHASGWGTRAGGYSGERVRNPKAHVPLFIALALVVTGTLVHS